MLVFEEAADMKLRIMMADPAGNRTAIVRTPVPQEIRADTAAKILGIRELRAEQAGFETRPLGAAAGRLEMMGGEFCGNAARSYGYLLASERDQAGGDILIEISGHTGSLHVQCDLSGGTSFSEMPVPLSLEYTPEGLPLVISEGIAHIILRDREPNRELIRFMTERFGSRFDAFGMMFLNGDRLTPVVFVPTAGTLVYESSCGSGSLAAAWFLEQERAEVSTQTGRQYIFREPGGDITVRLYRQEDGSLSGVMGGPVQLEEEITVWI